MMKGKSAVSVRKRKLMLMLVDHSFIATPWWLSLKFVNYFLAESCHHLHLCLIIVLLRTVADGMCRRTWRVVATAYLLRSSDCLLQQV